MDRTNRALTVFAFCAFFYAVLGNYVALPGYLRFLERGGTSAAGNSFDMDVVLGAIKTIAWMLAFNLGAICLYLATVRRHCPQQLRLASGLCLGWMVFWMIPELPRPEGAFFMVFGGLILGSILYLGWSVSAERRVDRADRFYLATALLFFAMATWDVCGLGSTGRILHPEQVVLDRSQILLETQVIKLMCAFVIAWVMLALSFRTREPA